jgi:hypothetical protein
MWAIVSIKKYRADAGERDEKFYGTPSDKKLIKLLDEGIDLFHVPKVKDN